MACKRKFRLCLQSTPILMMLPGPGTSWVWTVGTLPIQRETIFVSLIDNSLSIHVCELYPCDYHMKLFGMDWPKKLLASTHPNTKNAMRYLISEPTTQNSISAITDVPYAFTEIFEKCLIRDFLCSLTTNINICYCVGTWYWDDPKLFSCYVDSYLI